MQTSYLELKWSISTLAREFLEPVGLLLFYVFLLLPESPLWLAAKSTLDLLPLVPPTPNGASEEPPFKKTPAHAAPWLGQAWGQHWYQPPALETGGCPGLPCCTFPPACQHYPGTERSPPGMVTYLSLLNLANIRACCSKSSVFINC